ncbi:MAG: helix-turn-helix transcriptional regulator [Proteobacteria bacterium]|nr:helix-turn-helix transcriptional regulator [Pseudomonadota bacterium]
MPKVNPKILVWARKTSGLSPEEAVKKISLGDAWGVSAVDRLASLENGTQEPTRPQLVKMAKQYRRPLLTFYLADQPVRGDRGEDFRTLPDSLDPGQDALVDALIRDIRARQEMVRVVLEEDEELNVLDFVGSTTVREGVEAVKSLMVDFFGLDIEIFRNQRSPEKAFAYLRACVEETGVFVLLIGNLGSHHSAIDLKVFRGFALADNYAPFIVINDSDSKSAWSFTLLHELTHLLLGQTGISGGNAERRIEKFCNDVAGQVLLPPSELVNFELNSDLEFEEIKSLINSFARARNVSATMVAYNLFREGRLGIGLWEGLRGAFREDFLLSKEKRRARAKESKNGPDYYVVRRQRIGNALLEFVERTLRGGEISTIKAGKVLGVKPRNVGQLIQGSASSSFGLR